MDASHNVTSNSLEDFLGCTMADSAGLFEAVANRDYRKLASLYASNASQVIVSFLSVKSRWHSNGSSETRGGTYDPSKELGRCQNCESRFACVGPRANDTTGKRR